MIMNNDAERDRAQAAVPSKGGIGNLTVKSTLRPNVQATIPAVAAPEGGKGGKGGLPPLPPSNAAFLAAVICDVDDNAHAAVCSKQGDPTEGGWHAMSANDVDRQCPTDRNNYFNCSSFVTVEGEAFQARKDRFSNFHVIVLDDVGTKVDRAKLGNLRGCVEKG